MRKAEHRAGGGQERGAQRGRGAGGWVSSSRDALLLLFPDENCGARLHRRRGTDLMAQERENRCCRVVV